MQRVRTVFHVGDRSFMKDLTYEYPPHQGDFVWFQRGNWTIDQIVFHGETETAYAVAHIRVINDFKWLPDALLARGWEEVPRESE